MTHTTLEKGTGEKEALLRSAANLRDFIENAPEGLRRIGPTGHILWANQAELDMLGYAREEYIGHHITEFHVDAQVIEDFLARLSRGEMLREHEARMICKDGSIRHVLTNSSALFKDGNFIHTRCFTRDITDRKRADEKMISAYEQELAAREVAEAAIRNKDEFISVVLHALRPSLNAILSGASMLRENSPDAAQLIQSCDLIERNARAQLHLIEDLLAPSRAAKLASVRRLMFEPGADATYEASSQAALGQE
ncbi:MAG: PAS domain S-box protein [Blastocatellia bacterium]|nr:PAS domain S-box protein [Blastocatellia bacterium]